MSDIDFEELDKAVSSLMGQVTTTADGTASASVSTPVTTNVVTPPVSQEFQASPVQSQPSADVAPITPVAAEAPATSPLVERRSGRFMDVIPSVNGNGRTAPPRVPSRETKPLQPLSDMQPATVEVSPVVSPQASVVMTQSSEPAASIATEVTADEALLGDLDARLAQTLSGVGVAHTEQSQSPVEPMPPEEDVAQPEEAPTPDVPAPVDIVQTVAPIVPLESPFLEGVAVDKRPLGEPVVTAIGQQDVTEEQLTASFEAIDEKISESVVSGEIDPVAPTDESWAAPSDDVSPLSVETPLVSGSHVDTWEQQLTPATETPEPAAIFDAAAEETHTLQHSEKKRSGWLTFVWILLLVVIGVAGGIAAWYFLIRQ